MQATKHIEIISFTCSNGRKCKFTILKVTHIYCRREPKQIVATRLDGNFNAVSKRRDPAR